MLPAIAKPTRNCRHKAGASFGLLGGVKASFAITLLAALTACVEVRPVEIVATSNQREVAKFQQIPLGKRWTNEPGSLVAIQRSMGPETEQIIGLENNTAMRGDNFLYLLAARNGNNATGRLSLESLLARSGDIPFPFTSVSDRNLQVSSDSLGDLFWLEFRSGGDVNCVLAFRRVTLAARVLPSNAKQMDVMLRNCVVGDIPSALVPISDVSIGSLPVYADGRGNGRPVPLLSPLAGPRQ